MNNVYLCIIVFFCVLSILLAWKIGKYYKTICEKQQYLESTDIRATLKSGAELLEKDYAAEQNPDKLGAWPPPATAGIPEYLKRDKRYFIDYDLSKIISEPARAEHTVVKADSSIILHAGNNYFGRSHNGINFVIKDNLVSRKHFIIRNDKNKQIFILDCGSKNGTWVNGMRLLNAPVQLKEGDEIMAGSSTFKVFPTGSQGVATVCLVESRVLFEKDPV